VILVVSRSLWMARERLGNRRTGMPVCNLVLSGFFKLVDRCIRVWLFVFQVRITNGQHPSSTGATRSDGGCIRENLIVVGGRHASAQCMLSHD
jgi:hypothetical protein